MRCESPGCENERLEAISGIANLRGIYAEKIDFKFCVECIVKRWEDFLEKTKTE
jgi:hypothetical protein